MKPRLLLLSTLMLSGRAMTLAFIHRAGGGLPGDPPASWLMPLIGDAIVGITGLFVAWLIATRRGLHVWTTVIVWNAVATWDALSAFIIQTTDPWPEFFMLRLLGPSMFFIAAAMHLANIYLASQGPLRQHLGLADAPLPTRRQKTKDTWR